MENSSIVAFYLGQMPDDQGRMIDDILSWDDKKLEDVHDYIQWLFPLKERSNFNISSPILTDSIIAEFKSNSWAKVKLLYSLTRMVAFYGFATN